MQFSKGDWDETLNESKMDMFTSEFAASILGGVLPEDRKEELLPYMYDIADYELEFIYNYTLHLLDMLAEIDKIGDEENPTEMNVDEIIQYSLNHMGIDGRVK